MYVGYNEMPLNSRVWIYQANRELKQNEVESISENLIDFLNTWQRHGDDLKASFLIKYNQFVIVVVDENFTNVSGCSIDASVKLFQQFENDFKVDFTNKMNISFKTNETINVVKLADFQQYAKENKITSETIVFNNMVASKEDFENKWEVEAQNSWHKRFLAL
ncbi:ABC transporter ATPase [Lutibacter sp. TH_r2]|uniref:ABC transporter ATPase n=1 Tax=Lutibacter sp. TH_r2 TaxID=3082083 RepID=UPI002954791B|nr:ABC transporter ATPase [Lutibacter sp. TH_r2]MDV7185663.1 ABC transporter ATPase [Lutibacter sp. TH_r2]